MKAFFAKAARAVSRHLPKKTLAWGVGLSAVAVLSASCAPIPQQYLHDDPNFNYSVPTYNRYETYPYYNDYSNRRYENDRWDYHHPRHDRDRDRYQHRDHEHRRDRDDTNSWRRPHYYEDRPSL
ncbi:MAG: hypothetical protein WC612_07485 [Bdellovibrionales bacterium]|jgi:hypothetical protein